MKNLNSNKAYGHDMINILMLKLWRDAICRPLEIIFKTSLRNTSIHKKDDKQTTTNLLLLI